MKSQIKVDFKGTSTGLQPVIAIKMQDSEDPRDGLLKAFFEQLGGTSSWLSVTFDHHIVQDVRDATTFITLYPISPSDLQETAIIVSSRINSDIKGNFNPLTD